MLIKKGNKIGYVYMFEYKENSSLYDISNIISIEIKRFYLFYYTFPS